MTKSLVPTLFVAVVALAIAAPLAVAGDAEVQTVTGKAVKVDAEQGTLSVEAEGGKTMTFDVDEQTKVVREGAPGVLADLAAGDTLVVNYKQVEGETLVALTIGVQEQKG